MKKYRIEPDSKVDLSKWDPEDSSEFDGNKEEGRAGISKWEAGRVAGNPVYRAQA